MALRGGLAAAVAIAIALLAAPLGASGATLKPGDVLIADESAFGGSGGVIKVNPKTGKQSVLSSNALPSNVGSSELFGDPWSLTVTPEGRVLVTDWALSGVISVDPADGKETLFSSNGQPINSGSSEYFATPLGVVRLPIGWIAVANGSPSTVGVVAINPSNGKQSIISSNGEPLNSGSMFFSSPYGMTLDAHGGLVVADSNAFSEGGLIGVNVSSGKERELSSNNLAVNSSTQYFGSPSDVRLYDGKLYVSDGSGSHPRVIVVNPGNGKQKLVSSNSQAVNSGSQLLEYPYGIAVEPSGRILVSDESAFADNFGGVIAVNRKTGKQRLLSNNLMAVNSSSDHFRYPDGIAIVPPKCGGKFATIVGTPGKDKLTGTRFADVIAGLGGNDKIRGLKGNDKLCGGGGRDRISGGPGHDYVKQ